MSSSLTRFGRKFCQILRILLRLLCWNLWAFYLFCSHSPQTRQYTSWFFFNWLCETFITTGDALYVCACALCLLSYCYECLHFQGHIEQWLEFTSVEIYGNIVIWFKPRDGRAVYLPQVGYKLTLVFIYILLTKSKCWVTWLECIWGLGFLREFLYT